MAGRKDRTTTPPASVTNPQAAAGHEYTAEQAGEALAAIQRAAGSIAEGFDTPAFLARAWRYQQDHRHELDVAAAAAGLKPHEYAGLAVALAAPIAGDGADAMPPPLDPGLVAMIAEVWSGSGHDLWEPDPTARHELAGEPKPGPLPQRGRAPEERGLTAQQARRLLHIAGISLDSPEAASFVAEVDACAAFIWPALDQTLTAPERAELRRKRLVEQLRTSRERYHAACTAMLGHIGDLERSASTVPSRLEQLRSEFRRADWQLRAIEAEQRSFRIGMRGKKETQRDLTDFIALLMETWKRYTGREPAAYKQNDGTPSPFPCFVAEAATYFGEQMSPIAALRRIERALTNIRAKTARRIEAT